ncbi:hypothetical protein C882_1663 [Caenispirillum salinarum AK4]|uniref:Uncharacterized protein n=1 Tax=Caenispirillum salinarum AK4 TaxID=1238182 RepID=K9H3H3_9PROT|nr:hypothetical protein [Caenispirillum salinarum]EKV32825.1 hypothetical protein C882_1663 [Caenispirillum salinarum AK4]
MTAALVRRVVSARCIAAAMAAAGALALVPGAAGAADPAPFAGVAPVKAATLAETRGGMRIGAFDFDIGVALNTALDEGLDLTSRFQAVGGRLTRAGAAVGSAAGAAGNAIADLPNGGVAWRPADGLTVLHDPAGLGGSTVLNRLDNQAIRTRLEVNIRVSNYRERLGALQTGRALSGILREMRAASP